MPRARITRTAFGCSGLGWLPALAAVTAPPDSCPASASAICERALLPVHRKSTRADATRGSRPARGRGVGPRPGCSDTPALGQQLAAARQIEDVVGVAAVGRAAAHRDETAVAQLAQVIRDEALAPARQRAQLADAPIAARQLAQQAPPQRVPRQPQKRRR